MTLLLFAPSILSFLSRPCWSTVSESTMLFYNLILLMLFTFQLVASLPLSAQGQRLDGQPCPQPDPQFEGLLEGTIDQPDEPPPGLSANPPATRLSPSQPTTAQAPVATVTTIQSNSGVTETCIITLTPIGDKVKEVKNCTLSTLTAESSNSSTAVPTYVSKVTSSSSSVQTSSSAIITTSSAPVLTYSTSVQASSTPVSTYSSSVQTSPAIVSTDVPSSSLSISTSSSPDPTSTSPVSTSPSSVLTSTPLAQTPAPSSVKIKGKHGSTSSVSDAASSISATPTSSLEGTVAAANATGDKTVPGRKLSVLPIGLGVFAGISVIALVVVGLVTYERTKYRKAFRQRKLAESGAAMGLGGNAF